MKRIGNLWPQIASWENLMEAARAAARAKRKRERVEKDRFARAGLAGEDREAGGEFEIELVDQHHIADGEAREHGGPFRRE